MSSNPKQFLRRQSSLLAASENPIDISAVSQTNTGIVRIRKGTVYMNLNKGTGDEDTPYWLPIIVRDEYGNAVEMVRHSDEDDLIESPYSNNQELNNNPLSNLTDRANLRGS